MSEPPVPVLYIGGEGRSGSTMLSAMLGNREGYFPVGELPDVWLALQRNELCGCGLPFAQCEFWQAVGDTAYGGWAALDIDEIMRQEARYTRHRRIPRLISRSRFRQDDPDLAGYLDRLVQLYRAIQIVSGCSVIVDSTKRPPFAIMLRSEARVYLRVVHLVRDSRGVAFSWSKTGIRSVRFSEHPSSQDETMPTIRPWRSELPGISKTCCFTSSYLRLSGFLSAMNP